MDKSYDLLEWFPILYCQSVFKHLSGKDLIEASAVNKEWYNLVAESAQMDKLKLVIDRKNPPDMEILTNSIRKYQHIMFHGIVFEKLHLSFIAGRAGWWKTVKMDSCGIGRVFLHEILQIIETSVEKLSMDYVENVNFNSKPVDWTFPHLKNLKINFVKHILKHFSRCTALVSFQWFDDRSIHDNDLTKHLLNLALRNHNLEFIQIVSRTLWIEFKDNAMHFGLQLDHSAANFLYSFLETKAQTLESLEMYRNLNQTFLELILNMPRLSSFSNRNVNILKVTAIGRLALPINNTITTLKMEDATLAGDSCLDDTWVGVLKNLKHFRCFEIDEKALLPLARTFPDLESLKVDFFKVTRLPEEDLFPNMKIFQANKFSQQFEEPTSDNNFSALVKKEYRPYFGWYSYRTSDSESE